MGIVFRQSAKTSIIVFTGAVLGAFVLWLSTKYFPEKHQFGFLQDITNKAVTLSQIVLLGLNSTLGVYIHRFANNDKKRKLLITICLFIPLIVTAIVTILYFAFRSWIIHHYQPEDIPYMQQYFNWLPLYTLLLLYQLIFELYLGSQMKVAVAAFMREVVLRIINIALIFLFAFQYINFSILVAGTVLMYATTVCIFLLLSFKTKAFGLSFEFNSFTRREYRELIHFSWYHFLLSIVLTMITYMDMLLLPFYDHSGFGALAIYRVAVFLTVIMYIPSRALVPASFAVMSKAFAENDHLKAKDLFVRSSINILIPTVCVAVLLFCNMQNIIAVIKNGYSEIAMVFLILFIGRIVDLSTGMNDSVLSVTNYYKFNFYLCLVLVGLFFILMKTLVPRYSIYGAAWSTTIIVVIFNIAKYIFIKKKLDMQPFSMSTVRIMFSGAMAFMAGHFFPYFFNPDRHIYVHTFIDVVLRSTVIVFIYLLMLLWLKPSKDLEEYFAAIKKNKRLF